MLLDNIQELLIYGEKNNGWCRNFKN
jgi:hypothetical protein